jgi:hypothetical protein
MSFMTTDNFCFYLQKQQNRLIQASQTGGQQYSDTFPFSIPWQKPFQSNVLQPVFLPPKKVFFKFRRNREKGIK